MAGHTASADADMLEARHLECGWAGMTGFTGTDSLDMIIRLGRGRNPATGGMAASTVPGRIFEDAVHVALFTAQGSVYVPEQESGPGVIKGRNRGSSLFGRGLYR